MFIINISDTDKDVTVHVVVSKAMLKKIADVIYPPNAIPSKGRQTLDMWLSQK